MIVVIKLINTQSNCGKAEKKKKKKGHLGLGPGKGF